MALALSGPAWTVLSSPAMGGLIAMRSPSPLPGGWPRLAAWLASYLRGSRRHVEVRSC